MALTRATDKIIGNSDGNLNLSGIVTASSFSGPLVPSGDVNVGNNIKLGAASGIVTATSFSGDGSNLTSLPAGLGTALSSTQTSPLNKLYYTNRVLSIASTTTVDHPATGTGAYTQYAEIQIEDNADLIIEDGDDLIPDILGLGDNQSTGAGGLGRLRVDTITNKSANGAVNFPNGLVGTSATFTGVLTYEDVTNVDSVGVITARSGIRIGATGANTLISGTATGIGIGTNNPSNALDVQGGTTNTAIVARSTDAKAQISLVDNSTTSVGSVVVGAEGDNLFFTSGSSGTERLRISSTGNITANTGNIIIGTAGKGIDFSAQTATSASGATTTGETLVHYEEGTWTATLYGNSTRTNTDTTTSTTNRAVTGTYRKIGSLVYVQALWTGLHNGGGNDMFNHQLQRIEGLPFPSSNASGTSVFTSSLGYNRGIYAAYSSTVVNDAIFYFWLGTNSTTVYPQASQVQQNVPGTLFHITSNSTSSIYYAFQMTYHTN